MKRRALQLQPVSALFKALGDETRLRVVALLAHGELCVCHLESALELSQPAVSRHLAVLKNAGVVEARRDGNWIHYRLAPQADPHRGRQLRALVREFANEKDVARDVARLVKAQGPVSCR